MVYSKGDYVKVRDDITLHDMLSAELGFLMHIISMKQRPHADVFKVIDVFGLNVVSDGQFTYYERWIRKATDEEIRAKNKWETNS